MNKMPAAWLVPGDRVHDGLFTKKVKAKRIDGDTVRVEFEDRTVMSVPKGEYVEVDAR